MTEKEGASTHLHAQSILNMPNVSDRRLQRYEVLYHEVLSLEHQLWEILIESRYRTTCFLRYGAWDLSYAVSLPWNAGARVVDGKLVYSGIEEWQVVLAEFYGEEATKLLRKREGILSEMYLLASRIERKKVGLSQLYCLAYYFQHDRKPWFGTDK